MYLGHPFLIYRLCNNVGVPFESNEAWIHPIKEIMVKQNKPSVPTPEEVYDSGNELSDEENLRAYQATYGGRHDKRGGVGKSSTYPPPPTRTSCFDEPGDGRAQATNELNAQQSRDHQAATGSDPFLSHSTTTIVVII